MKVGDLVRHKQTTGTSRGEGLHGIGIVTKVSRPSCMHPPSGNPVYVTAVWMDWRGERSIEQQYLEVVSEAS